jgi:hypothetical protein
MHVCKGPRDPKDLDGLGISGLREHVDTFGLLNDRCSWKHLDALEAKARLKPTHAD